MSNKKYRVIFDEGVSDFRINRIAIELFGVFSINAKTFKNGFVFWTDLETLSKVKKFLRENGLQSRYEIERV